MNENEMNLENQLRTWQPRRPAGRLKRKLYGSASQTGSVGMSLRWLAPAAACLLLAVTILNQQRGLSAASRHEPILALVSSNLSYTNLVPGGRNEISPASFEWTNLSGITSSIGPFSPGRMN